MAEAKHSWSREETILALELYYIISPGQDTANNPRIIALANAIGTTPNSVKLKLQNFKSLDPDYTASGRTGLSGASKLDKAIAAEFMGHWTKLIDEADTYRQIYHLPADYAAGKAPAENFSEGADIVRLQKTRRGQHFFRAALLASYNEQCCITGLRLPALLRASHIKPWQEASAEEKVSPANGLLLNALFDAAFDTGYISVSPAYEILVSEKLLKADEIGRKTFSPYEGQKIRLPSRFLPRKTFLEYHNDCVFLK